MADFIKQSWVFPVIQSVHLIGLAMLVGSICLVDLRMLGIGMRQSVGDLAAGLAPWKSLGLIIVIATGPLMFWSDLARYVINPAFLLKMGLLATALASDFTLHYRAVRETTPNASRQKLAAVLSLILWSSVVLAGRAIADFDLRVV
jgi:hypothetical protein